MKLLLCIFLSSTGFMLQASVQPQIIISSVLLAPEYYPTTDIEQVLIERGIMFPEPLKNFRANGGTLMIEVDNNEDLWLKTIIPLFGMQEPGTETQITDRTQFTPLNLDKLAPADKSFILAIIYAATKLGF